MGDTICGMMPIVCKPFRRCQLMPTRRYLGLVRSLTCSLAFVAGTCLGEPPPAASVAPAAKAVQLQAEFKKAKTFDERRAAAESLLTLGEDGGRRLYGIARAEFLARLPRYTAGFERSAAEVLRQRGAKGDPSTEVATLRKSILTLTAAAGLTKEMIQTTSDPALHRLEELLVVAPEDAFATAPGLTADRDELLALSDWAEKAMALVPEKIRGSLPSLPDRATVARELDASDAMAAVRAGPMTPADRQVCTALACSRDASSWLWAIVTSAVSFCFSTSSICCAWVFAWASRVSA